MRCSAVRRRSSCTPRQGWRARPRSIRARGTADEPSTRTRTRFQAYESLLSAPMVPANVPDCDRRMRLRRGRLAVRLRSNTPVRPNKASDSAQECASHEVVGARPLPSWRSDWRKAAPGTTARAHRVDGSYANVLLIGVLLVDPGALRGPAWTLLPRDGTPAMANYGALYVAIVDVPLGRGRLSEQRLRRHVPGRHLESPLPTLCIGRGCPREPDALASKTRAGDSSCTGYAQTFVA
jgi:hypothetical protein